MYINIKKLPFEIILNSSAISKTDALIDFCRMSDESGFIHVSQRKLAARWNWSKCKVSGFLSFLIDKKIIQKDQEKTTLRPLLDHFIICESEFYKGAKTTLRPLLDHKKTTKKQQNAPTTLPEIKLDFGNITPETWTTWIDYKKNELNKKYKTMQSEQKALNHLRKISNNNNNTAVDIINQSIAGNWEGLFPIKNNSNNNNSPVKQQQYNIPKLLN